MLADYPRIFQTLREAESLAKVLNDPRRHGQALVYLCISFYFAGQINEAVAAGEGALKMAEDLKDLGMQIHAHRLIGMSYLATTDYRRSEDSLSRSLSLLEGQAHRDLFGFSSSPAVNSRAMRSWSRSEMGKFLEAQIDAEEAVRIAEEIEHPASLTLAYWAAGSVQFGKGDFGSAMRLLEHALKILREANLPLLSHYVERSIGRAYARSGRVNEAILLLETTTERDRSKGRMAHHALTIIALAEAYLLAGRTQEAVERGMNALELAGERKEPGHQAYAFHLLAQIASRSEKIQVEKVEGYYRQAMALAEELGMQPLIAHCHLGLGSLYRRAGKRGQSQEYLTSAATMYREMGMPFWLENAEKEKLQVF
jgi:tetratricopeptide (TPR) repeat protein